LEKFDPARSILFLATPRRETHHGVVKASPRATQPRDEGLVHEKDRTGWRNERSTGKTVADFPAVHMVSLRQSPGRERDRGPRGGASRRLPRNAAVSRRHILPNLPIAGFVRAISRRGPPERGLGLGSFARFWRSRIPDMPGVWVRSRDFEAGRVEL